MKPTPFQKILIANRGEIALRIMRSARALGYRSVAVYSAADAGARHAREADQAVYVGKSAPAASYLNIESIINAALTTGADAIHPGYGFLAENAQFALACRDAGLVFIGPSPESIKSMGDKAAAKRLMLAAGVPCIPGYDGDDQDENRLMQEAKRIGFPVMVKATAGGGGRGIRRVASPEEFLAALRRARSEAETAFGDSRVIIERAITSPRHIEIQVVADRYGNVIHLGERDCSVQRRHQKLIEEAPSPAVTPELRARIGATAVVVAQTVDYEGAGTVEYLLDASGAFYFMEMNTRLQVEHPVTEAITGLDLVELQLRIAAGEALSIRQKDVRLQGHAIEVRVCSEDPSNAFAPQSGRMHLWQVPAGIRAEHALESGATVTADYDSMIAKLIGVGATREEARRRLILALEDLVALGVTTNRAYLASCLRHPVFVAGQATTSFIDSEGDALLAAGAGQHARVCAIAAVMLQLGCALESSVRSSTALTQRFPISARFELDGDTVTASIVACDMRSFVVTLGERRFELVVVDCSETHARITLDSICETVVFVHTGEELLMQHGGMVYRVRDLKLAPALRQVVGGDGKIRALMAGRVVAVHAAVGDSLVVGQAVFTLEAMKMEHTHTSPIAGRLIALEAKLDQQVMAQRVVAEICAEPASAAAISDNGGETVQEDA